MKKIFLLLTLTAPLLLHAQKKSDLNRMKDFYIGVHWGPDFLFLKNEGNTDNTVYNYNTKYSQTMGIELVKTLNEKFLISSGINLSRRSFSRTDECLTCDVEYTPYSEFIVSYTEIPLNLSYLFVNSRMDVLGTIGFTNSFRRNVTQELLSYRGEIETFNSANDYLPYIAGIQAGVGFNYTIRTNVFWGMNILYKQPLNGFSHRPELTYYSIGFNSSLFYKF